MVQGRKVTHTEAPSPWLIAHHGMLQRVQQHRVWLPILHRCAQEVHPVWRDRELCGSPHSMVLCSTTEKFSCPHLSRSDAGLLEWLMPSTRGPLESKAEGMMPRPTILGTRLGTQFQRPGLPGGVLLLFHPEGPAWPPWSLSVSRRLSSANELVEFSGETLNEKSSEAFS